MAMNEAAAPGHVCFGIRIHAIDIVQPPGIGIPVAAIDEPHKTVVAVLAVKSSAVTPAKAPPVPRPEIRPKENLQSRTAVAITMT
jgi:hypothetical protein